MCSPRGPSCMHGHAARDSKISQVRQKINCPSPQALSIHIILLDGISLQFDPAIDWQILLPQDNNDINSTLMWLKINK